MANLKIACDSCKFIIGTNNVTYVVKFSIIPYCSAFNKAVYSGNSKKVIAFVAILPIASMPVFFIKSLPLLFAKIKASLYLDICFFINCLTGLGISEAIISLIFSM